jgi:hypothetical protein
MGRVRTDISTEYSSETSFLRGDGATSQKTPFLKQHLPSAIIGTAPYAYIQRILQTAKYTVRQLNLGFFADALLTAELLYHLIKDAGEQTSVKRMTVAISLSHS